MKLLIDADACPVTALAAKLAADAGIPCVALCDTAHELNLPGVKAVTVEQGRDSVDLALVNLVRPGDAVVTQDYGLAALCLARRARVLTQNGLEISPKNVDELLYSRYLGQKARRAGQRTRGPAPRRPAQDAAFAAALRALLKASPGEAGPAQTAAASDVQPKRKDE